MKEDKQMASSPQQKKSKPDGVEDKAHEAPAAEKTEKEMADIVTHIDDIQTEIDKLNEQASEEILKVEQKYNKLRQPVYQRRNELLEQLPQFWLSVFMNHPQLGSLLSERDELLLHHLKRLEVSEFDDIKSGFRITFLFTKNQFFSNESLWREVHMSETGEASVSCSKIDFLPGQDWSKKRSSSAGQKRSRDEDSDEPLLALLLSDTPQDQSMDDIAEIIKDDIWPNPMQYFLGNRDDGEEDEGDVDEDELDEEGDEDEGEEDAGDEEEGA
jgi:template-activating factor I